VFGLVRGLVEWIPTSADWAGYVAGPLVVLGYLAGSVPTGELLAARRFRRQLDTGAHPRLDRPRAADIDTTGAVGAILAAGVTLLVATIAWDVGHEAAPPGSFSAIGTYANQAIGAWSSLALWTGTAAMLGSMAPAWTGFRRGGTGFGPAAALLLAYAPLLAASGMAAASVAYGLGQRWRVAVALGCAALVIAEYVEWVTDTQAGWGITNGPELSLWSAVVAVALVARNLRER
jgi:glycerol-3-phosphate acyltransferase PlsY